VLGNGLAVAALDYLDGRTMSAAAAALPTSVPAGTAFAVIADADGSTSDVERLAGEVEVVLGVDASAIYAPARRRDIDALWSWRDGVSLAVVAQRGGKVSEDIVVPLDRLRDAIAGVANIGDRHGLETCSWGHAGDGNLHATFLVDRTDEGELDRAAGAAHDLFALAAELGGSISGEHGLGLVKCGELERQWAPQAIALHESIKQVFDPKNLMNPGKKLARRP
jgi:FAD/FMN-containing dehydrogenase